MLRIWIEKQWQAHRWLTHLAVALGYALAYVAIRPFSVTLWPFASGLRVSFLMLTPRRYWPALVVGEVVPLAYFNLQDLGDIGLLALVLVSIPPLIFAMPVISWFRNRAGLFPTPAMINLTRLLVCMLVLSALWASINYVILLTVHLPSGSYVIPQSTWMRYLIGIYTVLLLVVPWVIMIRIRGRRYVLPSLPLRTPISHPLVRDTGIAVLILVGLMGWFGIAEGDTRTTPLMALFLPAVWLTLKHGWRMSVVGGTLSLVCVCTLLAWNTEPFNQQAQTLMAMAITSLYFFGARISEQGRAYGRAQKDAQQDKNAARNALALGEERLQHTAQALEGLAELLLRMEDADAQGQGVSREERKHLNSQAGLLHGYLRRMADSLHPSAWRERGLGAALHDTIGKTLHEAGIAYECDLVGRELRFFSPALQAALYRVTCDAVTALSSSPACAGLRITIRTGRRQGGRWVVLRVHSMEDDRRVAEAILNDKKRDGVAAALGAGFRSVDDARTLIGVFNGLLDLRQVSDGKRISMLLCDPVPDVTEPVAPIRLWVE